MKNILSALLLVSQINDWQWWAVAFFALFVWAIYASNKMSRERQAKNLASAMVAKKVVAHAELGSTDTLANKEGGIRLAFDKQSGAVLRYTKRDGHGLVVGPTGSGKSRDWQICAILDLVGRASMILVDNKASTTAMLAEYIASKCKLVVCNPFENQKGLFPPMVIPVSTPFNPLNGLTPDNYGFTMECERIADLFAGTNDTSKNENAAHFKDRATDLIAGVIMHVCDRFPLGERNLTTVRNVITSSNGQNFWLFVADVVETGTPYCQQKLASYAERDEAGNLIARGNKEVLDVLATASRYTRWLGNEDIGPSLEGEGLRYESLKETLTVVSLISPLQYLHTGGGKWLKLHVCSAIHHLWRNGRGKYPVYLFLDESDQYADPIIHAALNTARNFGIVLVVMVQQVSDIEARYGKQMGAFINGTAWKIFFSSDDQMTRETVERLSGTKAVMVPSVAMGDGPEPKMSFSERGIPLKAGYEVGEIPPDECLIKITGLPIIEAKRKPYWDIRELDGKWKKDPYED